MAADAVTQKLVAWKESLIDLSRRNPLVSLPTRSLLRLSDSPDKLWKLPAIGAKRLRFVTETIPGTETPRELGVRDRAVNPQDFKLLNNLRLKSQLSLNEQGVNVLFIVIGVLEWFDPHIGAGLRSPILLLPVSLERLPGNEGFLLARFEEDPRVNPTLRYRLVQNDINVTLPDTDPDEEDFIPGAYLQQMAEIVGNKPNWRVSADECLLGRFSYLNLVMYEELAQNLDAARRHPIIAAIAGDTEAAKGLPVPQLPPLDSAPPQRAFHVLPTDPSQERAILAVRNGQSVVIQGPPGTGKTQTIANIIAACMADGKRVLFVSEKMAALEAVYERLNAHGLAGLCLEAHSHKASKYQVLEQLRKARDETFKASEMRSAEIGILVTLRDTTNRAVAALHERRDPLGLSVYEARGIVAALGNVPDCFFALNGVETTDADAYHAMEQLAARLVTFHDLFRDIETHPWRGLKADRYSQELFARVRDAVTDLLKAADGLEDRTGTLWERLALPARPGEAFTAADADWILGVVELLIESPRPPAAWLREPDQQLAVLRKQAVEMQERYRTFLSTRALLLGSFLPEVLSLPHTELADRLGERNRSALEVAFGANWANVPEGEFAQTEAAAENAARQLERLVGSAVQLSALCGLPAPRTLAEAKAQASVTERVLSDPRPQPAWFAPGAIAGLRARAKEAQDWHAREQADRAEMAAIYTDRLYSLDLDALQRRFDTEHVSLLRFLKPQWYDDRKTLTSVLQPGASLNGRNLADDLRRARSARDLRRQLDANAADLAAIFGSHYRAEATDWNGLYRALEATEGILNILAGAVPPNLISRLVSSGGAVGELREQYVLVTGHLQEAESALWTLQGHTQIARAASRPISQVPFAELQNDFGTLRASVADFVAVRNTVRATCRQPGQATAAQLRDGLRTAAYLVKEEAEIRADSGRLQRQYAHLFSGLETDWTIILTTLDFVERFRQAFASVGRAIPESVIAAATGGAALAEEIKAAGEELRDLRRESVRAWLEILPLFEHQYLRTVDGHHVLDVAPFSAQRAWAELHLGAMGQLERWLDFEALRRQCAARGLLSFCEVMVRRRPPADQIPLIFRRVFHQRWLESAAGDTPELASLCAAEHAGLQQKFEHLDRRLIQTAPGSIRSLVKERRQLVFGTGSKLGELGALDRYLAQRKPRASVRKILSEIPNLLFRLKPCLMMSPLSVSLFLDPTKIEFNIVIFDEASQIFPEFALGPLLRGHQTVIAGDSKQLPPTSFFKGMQDAFGDEDDESAEAADPREFESILDAARVPLAEIPLTWHYRSRHESLIAFSNGQFYDGKLKTFPSARMPSVVSFDYVPNGVYYGGAGNPRNNPIEAERVAERVVAQVRQEPGKSVGVITMSEAQQECIRAAIERWTATDDALAAVLNEDRLDGFFVKNIENVQGDERDVIFLSVGYGKWPDGKVRMLFGPINREGGERRLNVAVTRAKERLTVVSSMLPTDINVTENTPRGPRILREYLRYAQASTGATDAGADTAAEEDPFVESVARTLEARGHVVRRLVGLSDYRVDLAIADPKNPEAFLLGIECDGENYQNGETARAREWLRADVLKGLGWRLHRVWSADWVRNPEPCLTSIEQAIRAAVEGESVAPTISDPDLISKPAVEEVEPPAEAPAPTPTTDAAVPAVNSNGLLPGLEFYADASGLALPGETATLYSDQRPDVRTRMELVDRVIQVESPVHADVIATRLCRAAGLKQAGARIQRIAQDTVDRLIQAGRAERRGDFLWSKVVEGVVARVPSPGQMPRPIEHISLEEIGAVALIVLRCGESMQFEEAVNETARTLGYERTGPSIRERIGQAISQLEYDNRIHNFNGQLRTLDT